MCCYKIIFAISALFLSVACFKDLNTAKVIFYYGPNDRQVYELDEATAILTNPNFVSSKKTTFYIHGYHENQHSESVSEIIDVYISRGDHNCLILDWAELADGDYLTEAVVNYKRVGPRIADVILKMFNSGLNLNTFHLVGHSLGGQMIGFIGREIIKKSNGMIILPRISALDPANPAFYILNVLQPISSEDAQFVDIIHTDAWIYGAPTSGGHADFWPNNGKSLQPGCPVREYLLLTDNDFCSHWQSWRLWSESVSGKNEKKFFAIKTWSWINFILGQYQDPKNIALMGIDCPSTARGNYYLTTNDNHPFARGMDGLKYS